MRSKITLDFFCVLALTVFLSPSLTFAQDKAEKVTYDDHAKPLLVQRCGSCHNGQKREGDLDVTNFTNLMQGGGSGTVIEPLDSSGSYLYSLITHEDSPEMPPSGTKIPDPEIQLIAKWIDGGALENKGSAAAKPKPKMNMALTANPNTRPEIAPTPLRIPLEPVITPKRASVLAIATSPWAPIVAVSTPKQIFLYDTKTLKHVGVLPMAEGAAHSLRFSRSGQLLIAGGGKDGAVGKTVVFDIRTGERVLSLGDELETLLAADISPNQEYVAFGGPSKLVKLLYTDGTPVAEIKKHTDWVTAIEFSPDGKYFASGDRNGGLHVWDTESGAEVFTLKGHAKQISEVSWRSDGLFLASASEDASIRIWEMKNGKQVKTWAAHGGGTTGVEFRRDGNLVSAGRDKLVKLWDQNGKMIRQFSGLKDVAVAVSNCDESDRVIAADWTGTLKVWNAADGSPLKDLIANPPNLATHLAFGNMALDSAKKAHQPIAEQFASTQQQLTGLKETLTAVTQSTAELQAKLTSTQQQFEAAKAQFDSTSAEHQQWRSENETWVKAKPAVAESLTKVKEASAALPKDAELLATVATLEKKVTSIDARMAQLKVLIEQSGQKKSTSEAQMKQLTTTLDGTNQELAAKTSQVKQLQNNMTAMLETQKKHQLELNTSLEKITQATAVVNEHQSNIAFVAQLKQLKEQLSASEQAANEKQAAIDAAHQTLVEAQKKVDAAQQDQAVSKQQAEELRKKIEALRLR